MDYQSVTHVSWIRLCVRFLLKKKNKLVFQKYFISISSHININFVPFLSFSFWGGLGDVVSTLKNNNYNYTWGNVTVKLAESFGFCWGVERAVQVAYEARKQFSEEKIWITNEIIHNPTVNKV